MGTGRVAGLVAGSVAGYAIVMWVNPARPSLRDGLRCIRRYPRVWALPAAFALVHAAFSLLVRVHESWMIPGAGQVIGAWTGWAPPPWTGVIRAAWLPTGESCAAIFNCIVTTFPLSALWAALFLVNWRGAQAALGRGMRRRFGFVAGAALHLGLALCAAAALCKPLLFLGLPEGDLFLGAAALERLGEIVNWLSFLFEYGLGVGVQIYLVLLCYAWLRGLTFDFASLRRFALRRFVFVVKWALVVMIVSSLGINLPLVAAAFQAADHRLDAAGSILFTRWLLVGTLTVFCAVQVLLVFHNETLGRAVGDQWRLWRHYGWHLGWLVIAAALHFFALEAADVLLPAALGPWTWPGALWRLLVHPVLWSALAGWFLVSWVCLFQRCERHLPDADELVRY